MIREHVALWLQPLTYLSSKRIFARKFAYARARMRGDNSETGHGFSYVFPILIA